MGIRKIVATMASVLLLVLILGVTGASADGVTGGQNHANLVSFDAIHNSGGITVSLNDFASAGNVQLEGSQIANWVGTSLFGAVTPDIVPVPPPPPSTTPEPGTLYLLLIGGGILALGMRRRAIES